MKVDSIFRAINIGSISDIQRLAGKLIIQSESGDALVDNDDVMQIITEFMETSAEATNSLDMHDIGLNENLI